MTGREHETVLREEAVAALNVRAEGIYVDATFGRGGHARRILSQLGPSGRLLALDRDPEAVAAAEREFSDEPRFAIVQRPFSMLEKTIDERGWLKKVNGILFDLGVSSPQLDEAARGFSFLREGPLDMRMDPARGESAAEWLQHAGEQEIADVLHELGEERYARRIARAIVRERAVAPIATTRRLAEAVVRRNPRGIALACLLVIVGVFAERTYVLLPSLMRPGLVPGLIAYHPTVVEWSLMAGAYAVGLMVFLGIMDVLFGFHFEGQPRPVRYIR